MSDDDELDQSQPFAHRRDEMEVDLEGEVIVGGNAMPIIPGSRGP